MTKLHTYANVNETMERKSKPHSGFLGLVVNRGSLSTNRLFPHKERTMNFIGIDLHKKTISACVMNQNRKVLKRQTLPCREPKQIVAFFQQWGEFQAVVEATASYEWLWQLLEPLAQRLVLAHPK